MKENSFPIKYALQPIYDQIGWEKGVYGLEPEYEVIFYVITKCYLVGDNIKYYSDGSIKQYYEIVYPFKDEYTAILNNNTERRYPEFDYRYTCYNQDHTYKLYDSYDEALNDRIINNKKQKAKYLATFPFDSDLYKKEEKILEEKINNIDKLEEFIKENTEDLVINENVKTLRK